MIVLDTNVLSELIRPGPLEAVRDWVRAQPLRTLHIATMTEAEIRYVFAAMPDGSRRRALAAAFDRFLALGIEDRILPFDRAAVPHFADFMAERRRAGRPTSVADAQIAAIARARGATLLATRNVADFAGCGVALVDPWRVGG